MKNNKISSALLIVLIVGFLHSNCFAVDGNIIANIRTDKTDFFNGEYILLDIEVKNNTGTNMAIYDDIPESLFVINSGNTRMKYNYMLFKMGGFYKIEKGKKWEVLYEIGSEHYNLPPDEYEIYLKIRTRVNNENINLKSNLVKIKVNEAVELNTYEKVKYFEDNLGKSLTGEDYHNNMLNLLNSIDKTNAYYNTVYIKYLRSMGIGGFDEDNEAAQEKIKEFIKQNEINLFGRFAVVLLETVVSNSGLRHREIISYMSEYKKTLVSNELKDFVDYRIYVLQNK